MLALLFCPAIQAAPREIVITATRNATGEDRVPAGVTVLTSKDWEKTGALTVREALERIPGLNVTEGGMAGNKVSLRGMGNGSTLILVDGRRLAGEDSPQTMNVYELNRLNLDRVRRIEVVRGTASALYGSDAMGGVIQIFTRKPGREGGYAGTRTGTREKTVYGGFSTGRLGKLDLQVDAKLQDLRKETNGGYSNFYGPRRFLDITGTYQFDQSRSLEFGASYLREQLRQDTSAGRLPMHGYSTAASREWNDNNRQDYHLRYSGSDARNDYGVLLYTNRLGKESHTATPFLGRDFDHSQYRTWGADVKDTYTANARHTLTYGAEYRQEKAGGTRMGRGTGNYRQEWDSGLGKPWSSAQVETGGAYLQDEWSLGSSLYFVPGLRYDHYQSSGGRWSPRAGLAWKMTPGLWVKTNYGRGYRAPTIFELYARMERAMGMVYEVDGNPDLRPEKSRDFDLAMEMQRGRADGSIRYFHNRIDDSIRTRLLGFYGGRLHYRYDNIRQAKTQGVEAEGKYAFDRRWSLGAGYTYLDARNRQDRSRLTGDARSSGNVELSWKDGGAHPWTLTLDNRWYRDYLNDDGRQYTYSLTGFHAVKDLGHRTTLRLGVDNLFDKQFGPEDLMGIYGRTWTAGVEMKW
ncbi:TonB-dependent receptor plug domain-containing protein [Acidaminococcus sp.]|uniref:TonB-dependent receptor plug domain-containing protein n=1 Tax=Acidaminococcus sp. TaxID=1872103 RepID=UPI003D7C9F4B